MGGRTDGLESVTLGGQEVGRALEASDNGGPGGGHGSALVGPPGAHVHAGPSLGCRNHAGGCRSHGRVIVQDGKDDGLQEGALAESSLDLEHGGVGEENLSLPVPPDGAGEPEVLQPLDGCGAYDPPVGEEPEFFLGGAEVLDGIQDSSRARNHPVAPPLGEVAGIDLEDRPTVGRAVLEGGVQHCVLVHVGHQGRGCPVGFVHIILVLRFRCLLCCPIV